MMETDKLQETVLSKEDCGLLINLPQEIIVEILLRLPVKSLLKFRCVSKSWLSLISSSHFIRTQIKISSFNSKFSRHRLLLGPCDAPAKCYSFSLYSILNENSTVNHIELVSPHQDPSNKRSFVGICNGLFCLLERSLSLFDHSYTLIFWNPSTRKSKKLLNWGTDNELVARDGGYFTYGFGYDESNDDYKVVQISCFRGNGLNFESKVNVYSLRRKSWRKIEDCNGGTLEKQFGVFLNGALHWGVVNCENSPVSRSIILCNLAEEGFEEKPLQCFKSYNLGWGIGVLKECLAFYDYDEVEMDVWVLKKYGVNESWTKLFIIPFCVQFADRMSPLFVIEEDKILLKCGRSLMLFNSQGNAFKHAKLDGHGDWFQVAATNYVESLVSPDSYYDDGN